LPYIKKVSTKTKSGQETIEETGQVLKKIQTTMNNNLNQIQNISKELTDSSQHLTSMAKKLEGLSNN